MGSYLNPSEIDMRRIKLNWGRSWPLMCLNLTLKSVVSFDRNQVKYISTLMHIVNHR